MGSEGWRIEFIIVILELSKVDAGRVASNGRDVSSLAPTKILGRSSVLHTCPGVGWSKSKSKHTNKSWNETRNGRVKEEDERGSWVCYVYTLVIKNRG